MSENELVDLEACPCCGGPAEFEPNYKQLVTCPNDKCPHFGHYAMLIIWNTRFKEKNES
jgi:hypothetical protein